MFSTSQSWEPTTRRRVTRDEVQHFLDLYRVLAGQRGVEVPAKLVHKVEVAVERKSDDQRFPRLGLKRAQVTDDQVKVLALALWEFPIVGVLDLRYNEITHHGVSALMEVMRHQLDVVVNKHQEESPPFIANTGAKWVCLHIVRAEGNPVETNAAIMQELLNHTKAATIVSTRLSMSYAFYDNDRGGKGHLTSAETQSAVADVLGFSARHWPPAKAAIAQHAENDERVALDAFQDGLLALLHRQRRVNALEPIKLHTLLPSGQQLEAPSFDNIPKRHDTTLSLTHSGPVVSMAGELSSPQPISSPSRRSSASFFRLSGRNSQGKEADGNGSTPNSAEARPKSGFFGLLSSPGRRSSAAAGAVSEPVKDRRAGSIVDLHVDTEPQHNSERRAFAVLPTKGVVAEGAGGVAVAAAGQDVVVAEGKEEKATSPVASNSASPKMKLSAIAKRLEAQALAKQQQDGDEGSVTLQVSPRSRGTSAAARPRTASLAGSPATSPRAASPPPATHQHHHSRVGSPASVSSARSGRNDNGSHHKKQPSAASPDRLGRQDSALTAASSQVEGPTLHHLANLPPIIQHHHKRNSNGSSVAAAWPTSWSSSPKRAESLQARHSSVSNAAGGGPAGTSVAVLKGKSSHEEEEGGGGLGGEEKGSPRRQADNEAEDEGVSGRPRRSSAAQHPHHAAGPSLVMHAKENTELTEEEEDDAILAELLGDKKDSVKGGRAAEDEVEENEEDTTSMVLRQMVLDDEVEDAGYGKRGALQRGKGGSSEERDGVDLYGLLPTPVMVYEEDQQQQQAKEEDDVEQAMVVATGSSVARYYDRSDLTGSFVLSCRLAVVKGGGDGEAALPGNLHLTNDGTLVIRECGLHKLDLSPTITDHPDWAGTLQTLDLSSNQLGVIDAVSFGFYELEALTSLNLSHNLFQEMKPSLGEYPRTLTSLDLSGNLVKVIRGLETCPRLTSLNVSSNKIKYVDGIQHLTSLRDLDVSHNLIGKSVSLRALSFSPSIRVLNMSHNPVESTTNVKVAIKTFAPFIEEVSGKKLNKPYTRRVVHPINNKRAKEEQDLKRYAVKVAVMSQEEQEQADRRRCEQFKRVIERRRKERDRLYGRVVKKSQPKPVREQLLHATTLSLPRQRRRKSIRRVFNVVFGRSVEMARDYAAQGGGGGHRQQPRIVDRAVLRKMLFARKQERRQSEAGPVLRKMLFVREQQEEAAEEQPVLRKMIYAEQGGQRGGEAQEPPSLQRRFSAGNVRRASGGGGGSIVSSINDKEGAGVRPKKSAGRQAAAAAAPVASFRQEGGTTSQAKQLLAQVRLEDWLLDAEQDMTTTLSALQLALRIQEEGQGEGKEGGGAALARFRKVCSQVALLQEVSLPPGLRESIDGGAFEEDGPELKLVQDMVSKSSDIKAHLRTLLDLLNHEDISSPAVKAYAAKVRAAYSMPSAAARNRHSHSHSNAHRQQPSRDYEQTGEQDGASVHKSIEALLQGTTTIPHAHGDKQSGRQPPHRPSSEADVTDLSSLSITASNDSEQQKPQLQVNRREEEEEDEAAAPGTRADQGRKKVVEEEEEDAEVSVLEHLTRSTRDHTAAKHQMASVSDTPGQRSPPLGDTEQDDDFKKKSPRSLSDDGADAAAAGGDYYSGRGRSSASRGDDSAGEPVRARQQSLPSVATSEENEVDEVMGDVGSRLGYASRTSAAMEVEEEEEEEEWSPSYQSKQPQVEEEKEGDQDLLVGEQQGPREEGEEPEWVEGYDDNYQQYFYFNERTGLSQWTKPDEPYVPYQELDDEEEGEAAGQDDRASQLDVVAEGEEEESSAGDSQQQQQQQVVQRGRKASTSSQGTARPFRGSVSSPAKVDDDEARKAARASSTSSNASSSRPPRPIATQGTTPDSSSHGQARKDSEDEQASRSRQSSSSPGGGASGIGGGLLSLFKRSPSAISSSSSHVEGGGKERVSDVSTSSSGSGNNATARGRLSPGQGSFRNLFGGRTTPDGSEALGVSGSSSRSGKGAATGSRSSSTYGRAAATATQG